MDGHIFRGDLPNQIECPFFVFRIACPIKSFHTSDRSRYGPLRYVVQDLHSYIKRIQPRKHVLYDVDHADFMFLAQQHVVANHTVEATQHVCPERSTVRTADHLDPNLLYEVLCLLGLYTVRSIYRSNPGNMCLDRSCRL